MAYVVEREEKWVIYKEPEDASVSEHRSFVGECGSQAEADAEVEKLEAFARFKDVFEGA